MKILQNLIAANLFYIVVAESMGYLNPSKSKLYEGLSSKRMLYDNIGLAQSYHDHSGRSHYRDVAPFPRSSLNSKVTTTDKRFNEGGNRFARYLGDNNIICEIIITEGNFAEDGYEFYPSTYINKTCAYSEADPFKIESNGSHKPEVCLHNDNDFGCQTLYDELKVLKKNTNGKYECWERMTQLVAVGCKCNIRFQYN